MSDVLRSLYAHVQHSYAQSHMRPRVQRASGIPCALCFREGENYLQASGKSGREIAKSCLKDFGCLTIKSEIAQAHIDTGGLRCQP